MEGKSCKIIMDCWNMSKRVSSSKLIFSLISPFTIIFGGNHNIFWWKFKFSSEQLSGFLWPSKIHRISFKISICITYIYMEGISSVISMICWMIIFNQLSFEFIEYGDFIFSPIHLQIGTNVRANHQHGILSFILSSLFASSIYFI